MTSIGFNWIGLDRKKKNGQKNGIIGIMQMSLLALITSEEKKQPPTRTSPAVWPDLAKFAILTKF